MPPADVVALRPFVPAKELDASLSFYEALGFTATRFSPELALMELGAFGFLLQQFKTEGFAENYMMQWTVADLPAVWTRIQSLDLAANHKVQKPRAPALQPWGLTVAYLFDPAGVLWHVVQQRTES